MSATANGPTGMGWSEMATADDIAPPGASSSRRLVQAWDPGGGRGSWKRSMQGLLKLQLRTGVTSLPPSSVSWSPGPPDSR